MTIVCFAVAALEAPLSTVGILNGRLTNSSMNEWIFVNWWCLSDYNLVDRNCTDQYTFQLDQCLTYSAKYNLVNFTFFTYGNSCCYSISGTSDGLKIQTIACECQADNCNGDLPHQIPNASFSPQAITELSIVVVATIAVLSIISWYIII